VVRPRRSRRVRRIGILSGRDETDPIDQTQQNALREELAKLGWIEGRNVRFDLRPGDPDRFRMYADELVRLAPDVIVVQGGPGAKALLQRTRNIPIVFTSVGDPVAIGLLKDIARPEGGNFQTTTRGRAREDRYVEQPIAFPVVTASPVGAQWWAAVGYFAGRRAAAPAWPSHRVHAGTAGSDL
jgi:hypothetical protein